MATTTTTKRSAAPKPIGEELKQMVKSKKIGTPVFRFDATAEWIAGWLMQFLKEEVERRGRELETTERLKSHIADIARYTTYPDTSKFGLMIIGSCGNGKTTMALALGKLIWEWTRRKKNPKIYTGKEIVKIAAEDSEWYRRICDLEMLTVDDLGEEAKEKLSWGNPITPMIDLIEHRYARRLYTIFTSNLDIKEISERYGARVADRLREMVYCVSYGNDPSHRK